jgi:asparagine synthase (glutamine-hydrolysing)
MCGLAGFVDFGRGMAPDAQRAVCGRMADALAHRGPDDRGVWTDPDAGIALGHRRLSILDLSPLGHQPMASESGRYVVSYNGEVYDFEALREELSGHNFRGRSDTEVILAAFEEWGVEAALPRFNGMFALAVWDTRERALWLARDRFGEKPLYYGRVGRSLVFGSELKALRAFPNFPRDIDRGALAQLMRFGYVPAPGCIFNRMRKLPAASFLRIASEDDVLRTPSPYWSIENIATRGLAEPFRGSDGDAVEALDALLRRSIKLRMVSDVPLGAFLSGGIDSSVIVAMMQRAATSRVKTFTIGFEDAAFNEAESAKAIAKHLGTDHTELYVTAEEARAVIPRLPSLYDEPFADSSQVPTFLVAQLARTQVTVALSGDAGDELFGGYNRYVWAEDVWGYLGRLPRSGRAVLATGIEAVSPSALDRAFSILDGILPRPLKHRTPGDKLHKLAGVLGAETPDDLYLRLASTWKEPDEIVIGKEPSHAVLQDRPPALSSFIDRMMCADTLTYLPDDILVKVDRAAMGVSLETRVPLLDPEIARFAWSLPMTLKLREGNGKWILREVLARYVPRALFERPKMGFAMPIDSWLRGPLRDWAEAALSEARLCSEGYFRSEPIRQRWKEHLSGRKNWQDRLWPVLMFQAWLEELTRAASAS